MSKATPLLRAFGPLAAVLALASTGCAPERTARGGENLLLITLCGARADVVDEVIASGAAPALAALRERAASIGVATTIESTAAGCWKAHLEMMTVLPESTVGHVGLDLACALDGYATAAFVSRSELVGSRREFSRFDGPTIDAVRMEMFGPKAAALELRRSPEATANAALQWLSHATTPFFAWIQFDALAIEQADSAGELREVAKQRLVTIDAAVARIVRELERGGRDRRTCVALVSDHGEAFGEEQSFGHRHLLPCVTQVPLWIVAPQTPSDATPSTPRSMREVGDLLALRLALSTRRVPDLERAPSDDAAPKELKWREDSDASPPLSFLAEQGRVPITDAAARAVLPKLRELLLLATDREQLHLAELYLGALHALDTPTDAEQSEQAAARKQWLEAVAFAGNQRRPFATTLYARPDPRNDAPLDRRLLAARNGCNVWPWYFPAVRAYASLEQMALRSSEAIAALENFGKEAPLTPAARAEFEKLLAATRRNVGAHLPVARPPR